MDSGKGCKGIVISSTSFKLVQEFSYELSRGVVDLPGFPAICPQVCQAMNNPDNTAADMAQIVGSEPVLAVRVLTTANSAAFTQTGKPLSELRAAITRLGDNLVRGIVTAYALNQLKGGSSLSSVRKPLDTLWAQSIEVAALSSAVARHCRLNTDEAMLTGLLHGIGTLYLFVRTAQRGETHDALLDLNLEWNAPIARWILDNWSFPDQIIAAVGEQSDLERKHVGAADLTDVLICSKTLIQCEQNVDRINAKCQHIPAFSKIAVLTHTDAKPLLQEADIHITALQSVLAI